MLQLFGIYFVIVVIIQGFIVGVIDSRKFARAGEKSTAVKARLISGAMIALAIVLFISALLI